MARQTFFFFFFQEKQATENGILQIYRHGEHCQNALQMARLCEGPAAPLLRPGGVSLPSELPGLLLPVCPRPQAGQCTRPSQSLASFTGRAAEEPAFTEPAGRQRAVLLRPLSGL